MASWFYASEGDPQGPFPADQFRNLVTQGVIRADTLVWTEGMPGWQKASEIQGLLPPPATRPAAPQRRGVPARAASSGIADRLSRQVDVLRDTARDADPSAVNGDQLSIDIGMWDLLWRGFVFAIGVSLIIPAPWVYVWFYKWLAPRIHVPGHRDLDFAGQPLDIWYVIMGMGLLARAGNIVEWIAGSTAGFIAELLALAALSFLAWIVFRWIVANLVADGQRLPISFNGSPIAYVGWNLLLLVSAFSIVGWAWVAVFWTRWMCRNIEGTRREVVFTATGLELLWRTWVFMIGCGFLIPIPWVLRWYARWAISQFKLVERDQLANVFA